MAPDTDDIQAKLCAYIEGELDAGQRAEIERHLAANPQSRAMLEEMKETRRLVQGLPRAKAPPELAEALAAQFERAALLGDPTGREGATVGRMWRWPQYAAAAAVLALAVGLGAVIFAVMRSGAGPGAPRAGEQESRRAGEGAEVALAPQVTNIYQRAEATEPAAAGPEAPKAGEQANRRAGEGGETAGAGPGNVAAADAAKREEVALDEAQKAANGSTKGAGNYGNPLWVVVSTADAAATNGQVTRFLESNRIEYQAVGPGTDEDALAQTPTAGKDGGAAEERDKAQEEDRKPLAAAQAPMGSPQAPPPPAAPPAVMRAPHAAPQATAEPRRQSDDNNNVVNGDLGGNADMPAARRDVGMDGGANATREPATQPALGGSFGANSAAGNVNLNYNGKGAAGGSCVYIASMSAKQADMLSQTLSKDAYQTAQVSHEGNDGAVQESLRGRRLPMSMQRQLAEAKLGDAATRPGALEQDQFRATTSPAPGPGAAEQQVDVVIVVEEKPAAATVPAAMPMEKARGGP